MTRQRQSTPHRQRVCLRVELLEDRTVLSGFTPTDIRHAYGFDQITFSNGSIVGDGTGQTIAIVEAYDDPEILADLQIFDQQYGLPDPSFTKHAPSGTVFDAGWAGEIALDVEWAHAIAPGASILLAEARTDSLTDLLAAVDYAAAQPGVSVISMSWGSSEWSSEHTLDSHFNTPGGHQGISFVASAGDNGAPPSWPAAAPNVLSVGGTALSLSVTGDYQSETTWSGGGGGISRFESKPAYQSFVSTNSSTKRTNPDVSYNADPNTGVSVYDSAGGGWYVVGGTSAGAPQWAALIAIADQGRALAGNTSLDSGTQTLYAVYRMAQTSATTYFHDVTQGSNGFSATVGYDDASGNGSPIADQVVIALVGWQGTGTTGSLPTSPGSPPPPHRPAKQKPPKSPHYLSSVAASSTLVIFAPSAPLSSTAEPQTTFTPGFASPASSNANADVGRATFGQQATSESWSFGGDFTLAPSWMGSHDNRTEAFRFDWEWPLGPQVTDVAAHTNDTMAPEDSACS